MNSLMPSLLPVKYLDEEAIAAATVRLSDAEKLNYITERKLFTFVKYLLYTTMTSNSPNPNPEAVNLQSTFPVTFTKAYNTSEPSRCNYTCSSLVSKATMANCIDGVLFSEYACHLHSNQL